MAETLGVKRSSVAQYMWRLGLRLSVDGASTISEVFLERNRAFICPECLEMSVKIVGVMRVCRRCGLELGSWSLDEPHTRAGLPLDDSLPFDTTYALTAEMSLGRSLGGTLPSGQTHRVIVRSPTGRTDAGLEARYMNIIHESSDSPTVKKVIEYGSGLLKSLGLDDDHELGKVFGGNLRKLGAYLEAKRVTRTHRWVHALLAWVLSDAAPRVYRQVGDRLRYGEDEAEAIRLWFMLDEIATPRSG